MPSKSERPPDPIIGTETEFTSAADPERTIRPESIEASGYHFGQSDTFD